MEPTIVEAAPAEKLILPRVSERLKGILKERVVHITADGEVRVYQETWGDEIPHVDIFFADYAVRLPVGQIAGYPWDSIMEQLESGHLGPVVLENGWWVWLGYIERRDAIYHDLNIEVRETCRQLLVSEDVKADRALQRLCTDFSKGFVFADDLELFRRLWRSSFDVADAAHLSAGEALTTLFLADLKRLIAPPGAEQYVAEVSTPWMKGFEFGDETSREGFSAVLFDERNHVSVLLFPPDTVAEPVDEEFRQKVVASVHRHGEWAPGLEMIRAAQSVLQSADLRNAREVGMLLLFSALQFADNKTPAAKMLVELFPEGTPGREELIEVVEAMIQ